MRVPFSWLKEFVAIEASIEEVADKLTMVGLEVEAIETVKPSFTQVVVGEVVAVSPHPNADKLVLAEVDSGGKRNSVVCGAPNCTVGLRTALALVGAELFDEKGESFVVKPVKLRGESSEGMLCSGKELGISEEADGIIDFGDEVAVGTDVAELYSEQILEVALTPNLGHCTSILGVARELAAVLDRKFESPPVPSQEEGNMAVTSLAKVVVEDAEGCPFYTCRVIQGVKVGPSPAWLRRKLEHAGIRSVNNVVDVTNYVMLGWGQPLHAFDFDRLQGNQVIVKKAEAGEVFTTLDGKHRTLNEKMMMIADEGRYVAIAGVMGGEESEVSDTTTDILLESAYFDPRTVRRASKQVGLQTDSSKRFEKGVDPSTVIESLNRAAFLIRELAGGSVAQGIIDVGAKEFSAKKVCCRVSRVNQILGKHLSTSEIETMFQRLNFTFEWKDQDTLCVHAPTYRSDISIEVDLIEEVARLYGYNQFQAGEVAYNASNLPHSPIFVFERAVRSRLIAEGLQEFLTCDLISPKLAQSVVDGIIAEDQLIKVLNPTSIEQSILRPSLLPGLLQLIKHNADRQNHHLSGFEIGRMHVKEGDNYKEQSIAGIVLVGKSRPDHWDYKPHAVDFYDLKGMVENVFNELRVEKYEFLKGDLHVFHPGRQSVIQIGECVVGSMGEVHPALVRQFDFDQRVYYAEWNLHDLIPYCGGEKKMAPLSQYPGSDRDWTVTLKEEVTAASIFDAIDQLQSPLLEDVALIDIFRSERLGKERKNVTFHFVYRDRGKTVSQEEVDAEHARLTEGTLRKLGKAVI